MYVCVQFYVKRTFIHKLIDHVKVIFVVVVVDVRHGEVTNEQSTKKRIFIKV